MKAGGQESIPLEKQVSSPRITARCSLKEVFQKPIQLPHPRLNLSMWKLYLPSLLLLHLCPDQPLLPLQPTRTIWSLSTSKCPSNTCTREKANGSYDAAEDNELSFKEGDRITEIDKVDENWWQGKANGATGLFPGKLKAVNPVIS
jgi:hypothetical protein